MDATESLKPYANDGVRITTVDGAIDFTPPEGAEYLINLPGVSVVVTHEGCALIVNPLARAEAVKMWADPKFDRLISEFGDGVGFEPPSEEVFQRVLARSLEWCPKGAYCIGLPGGKRLSLRMGREGGLCDAKDCPELATGQHPKITLNSARVNLCAAHLAEVSDAPL